MSTDKAKTADVPVVPIAGFIGHPDDPLMPDALVRQSAHLAAMEALRRSQTAALVELTVECERWAKEVAARDARIAELERDERSLHKALPGCFMPDGRAIVASAHLPRLPDTKKEQPK